jgi:CubicO group peptidase (beta-lactamase class C family)
MIRGNSRPDRALVLALIVTGCAPSYNNSAATSPRPAANEVAAIDSVMSQLMSFGLSPGVGVVVVRGDDVVYKKGFGYADVEAKRPFTPETVFYIASTTKSFTGLAAAVLDQQGKFDIDAPLSRYLPQLRLKSPLNADSITIRALLTHTHGIGNNGPVTLRLAYTGVYNGDEELVRLLAEHPAASTGREFNYGNIGYNVAALAMDAALKESWKETLQRVLFTPLGMTHTSAYISRFQRSDLATPYQFTGTAFVSRPYGKVDANMQSAGGLVTTLDDMGKWLEVNINNGKLDGKQILPAAVVMEAHRPLVPAKGNVRGMTLVGYGFGWNVFTIGNDTLLAHGGGFPGFSTHMSFMPGKKVGVVVMANNSELGGGMTEFAAAEIYSILLGQGTTSADSMAAVRQQIERAKANLLADLSRRAARPQNLPYPLSAYTGTFDNPIMGRLEISLVDGRLEARMGAAWSRIEVFNNTNNQLRVELFGNGEVVNVEMKDGKAATLTISGTTFTRSA